MEQFYFKTNAPLTVRVWAITLLFCFQVGGQFSIGGYTVLKKDTPVFCDGEEIKLLCPFERNNTVNITKFVTTTSSVSSQRTTAEEVLFYSSGTGQPVLKGDWKTRATTSVSHVNSSFLLNISVSQFNRYADGFTHECIVNDFLRNKSTTHKVEVTQGNFKNCDVEQPPIDTIFKCTIPCILLFIIASLLHIPIWPLGPLSHRSKRIHGSRALQFWAIFITYLTFGGATIILSSVFIHMCQDAQCPTFFYGWPISPTIVHMVICIPMVFLCNWDTTLTRNRSEYETSEFYYQTKKVEQPPTHPNH